ncbi:helix-turn-helix transcriptional regulator [Desulfotomaculum copahuensis]|uniref:PadR family transcriptional regulator n=1 Tax=Desulfotomaculum copahuensis TaxID=1838280 RepID=A0A1B7LCW1_9FIRM|nr:helix-turn-helix transcriptional regulator [Desulfotomaculum copahuensis]OAT80768.1 PadR family transcriptional regulator [Desulfotomaculum copahuensis]
MDHGSGHRHGDCKCAGAPMERFVQPCLLLLLHRQSTHGYDLIHSLEEFGFTDNEADPGTVYRNLRRMEEEGLVSSRWETGGGGPAKRLYRLTPEGEELLHAWAESVEHNKQRLENFLSRYRREFNTGG